MQGAVVQLNTRLALPVILSLNFRQPAALTVSAQQLQQPYKLPVNQQWEQHWHACIALPVFKLAWYTLAEQLHQWLQTASSTNQAQPNSMSR